MNNVFDFKRFGNYFLYDLRRTRNNYGISLLLMGLMPVAFFLVYQFISLISGNGLTPMPDELQVIALFVSIVVVILGAGAKIYGSITEKIDSKVNIEALFNTVHKHKELVKKLFNHE